MRLADTLPGTSAPKSSWVILPMAPMGVTSVSPVARAATMESRKAMATESTPSSTGTPNHARCMVTAATVQSARPTRNQLCGTSTAARASSVLGPPLKIRPRPEKARAIMRQRNAKETSEALTISEVPAHTDHFERIIAASASGFGTGIAWAAFAAFAKAR